MLPVDRINMWSSFSTFLCSRTEIQTQIAGMTVWHDDRYSIAIPTLFDTNSLRAAKLPSLPRLSPGARAPSAPSRYRQTFGFYIY